jgi:hypothetical protein
LLYLANKNMFKLKKKKTGLMELNMNMVDEMRAMLE